MAAKVGYFCAGSSPAACEPGMEALWGRGGRGADLRCAHVRRVKRVASMHTCVVMTTVFLPPSAIRSWERATFAHRYSVPYLSLPHPAARSVSPAASRDPAPTARAPAQSSRALAPTPVGCGPVPPPPRTRVISPPYPALLFAALTVPLSEQARPPAAVCPPIGRPAGLVPETKV